MGTPFTSSFEEYERELRTWIDRLKLVDTLLQRPALTLVAEVQRGQAAWDKQHGSLEDKERRYPVRAFINEHGRGPEAPLLVHAICCSTVQRLWGQRRRFPWLDEKALPRQTVDKLREPLVAMETDAGNDPMKLLQFLHDDVFGAANALTSAEVFWVLIKAGEKYAHGPLGFFCLFAMLWSLTRGAALPTPGGASIEPWRPSALVTAKCLLPLRQLTRILRDRARLYQAIAATYDSLNKTRKNRTQRERWLFATDLEALSSHLHEFAAVAVNREDFEEAARTISTSANPITPDSPIAQLERLFGDTTERLGTLMSKSAAAAAPALEQTEELLANIAAEIVDALASPGKRQALGQRLPELFDTADDDTWKSRHLAAKRAHQACKDALDQWQKGIAELRKYDVATPVPKSLIESLRKLSTINRTVAELIENLTKPSTLWMRRVLTQEVAWASAGNETDFDAAELLSAVTIVQRWQRISDLEVEDALKWSLKGARTDGSWATGQPIMMRNRFLGVWPSTPDIVWLLAMAVERKRRMTIADAALMNFVVWLDKTRTEASWTVKRGGDWHEASGWPSETREPDTVDLWATALSVSALLSIRDLIEDRLWSICERRFFVQRPTTSLPKIDPVDLGARHEARLHRRFMRMARESTGDGYASAEYALVLHGPPGSSKTALAEALADEMWRSFRDTRLLRITPADFTRQGEERVDSEARFIFDLLSHIRGVTIFFDEIDQLLQRRKPGEPISFLKLVVPAMLNRLQDLRDAAPRQEICFVFATNFVDTIDSALTRPGRIDVTVPVPYPDPWSRENIMQRIFADGPMIAQQQPVLIAETEGWPWSTFQKLCKELKAKPVMTVGELIDRINGRRSDFEEIVSYYKDKERLDSRSRAFARELVHSTFAYSKRRNECEARMKAIVKKRSWIIDLFDIEWRSGGRSPAAPVETDEWQQVTGPSGPRLGATLLPDGKGASFRVWAPHAGQVAVAGTFNNWQTTQNPLRKEGYPMYFSGDVADVCTSRVPPLRAADDNTAADSAPPPEESEDGPENDLPQFRYVITTESGEQFWKSDPFSEELLDRATIKVQNSVIPRPRAEEPKFERPPASSLVIYQLHPATFAPDGDKPGTLLTASDKFDRLQDLGVNAVEILMLGDRRYDEPWGYDPEYPCAIHQWCGGAEALRTFVSRAHEHGMSVIAGVRWDHVGRKTNRDDKGLRLAVEGNLWCFDGFPSEDSPEGGIYYRGPELNFNLEQPVVRDFLFEAALRWVREIGVDGLRWNDLAAVLRMQPKEKNTYHLLRDVNEALAKEGALTIAQHDGEPAELFTNAAFQSMWRHSFMEKLHVMFHKWEPEPVDVHMLAAAINTLTARDVVYSESYREAMEGRFPRYEASYSRRQRAVLAAVIVLTAPGIPMLFQRQEDFADGPWNHHARDDWTEIDAEMRRLYKMLIHLRTTDPALEALRGAGIATGVDATGKALWIHRRSDNDDALVVLNFNSSQTPVTFPVPRNMEWIVRFDTESQDLGASKANAPLQAMHSITLDMAPFSAAILSPKFSRPPRSSHGNVRTPAV